MRHNYYILILLLLAFIPSSCKTTEENYRSAYQKAVEARRQADEPEDNIFGGIQRRMSTSFVVVGNDSIPISFTHLFVITDGDKPAAVMKKFNIVVGQFKQKFNALSLSRRFAESGWPDTFVVQTAEPYYYVIASSSDSVADIAATMADLRSNSPLPLKSPLPFLISPIQ